MFDHLKEKEDDTAVGLQSLVDRHDKCQQTVEELQKQIDKNKFGK